MNATTADFVAPPKSFTQERASDRQRISTLLAAALILRTIAMVAGPAAICGISVGASSLILMEADPSLHRFLVTIVWGAAVLISSVMMTGLLLLGRQEP